MLRVANPKVRSSAGAVRDAQVATILSYPFLPTAIWSSGRRRRSWPARQCARSEGAGPRPGHPSRRTSCRGLRVRWAGWGYAFCGARHARPLHHPGGGAFKYSQRYFKKRAYARVQRRTSPLIRAALTTDVTRQRGARGSGAYLCVRCAVCALVRAEGAAEWGVNTRNVPLGINYLE